MDLGCKSPGWWLSRWAALTVKGLEWKKMSSNLGKAELAGRPFPLGEKITDRLCQGDRKAKGSLEFKATCKPWPGV